MFIVFLRLELSHSAVEALEMEALRLGIYIYFHLQEWNPDATQTINRREKPKKNEGGNNTPNASGGGEATAQGGDRGR